MENVERAVLLVEQDPHQPAVYGNCMKWLDMAMCLCGSFKSHFKVVH